MFISLQGLTEIDEAHDCYALKFLKKKPVKTLSGDAWLRLTQAEESKLVTLELAKEVPSLSGGHGGRTFLQEAQDLFKFDAFSKSAQEWNSLRAACVEIAFKDILFPMLRKELRLKLTKEAKDGVIRAYRSKLYEWIKVGKYSVKFEEEVGQTTTYSPHVFSNSDFRERILEEFFQEIWFIFGPKIYSL